MNRNLPRPATDMRSPAGIDRLKAVLEDYHRFDDGLRLSFEYVYEPGRPLAARILLHARNHALPGYAWRKVRIAVGDVHELRAQVRGHHFNAIGSGVKLIPAGTRWCIDVDGDYDSGDECSVEEVRAFGTCFVIGSDIDVEELPAEEGGRG